MAACRTVHSVARRLRLLVDGSLGWSWSDVQANSHHGGKSSRSRADLGVHKQNYITVHQENY